MSKTLDKEAFNTHFVKFNQEIKDRENRERNNVRKINLDCK